MSGNVDVKGPQAWLVVARGRLCSTQKLSSKVSAFVACILKFMVLPLEAQLGKIITGKTLMLLSSNMFANIILPSMVNFEI